jgi:ribosomal protein S18 acetylase RimI-like enzyme
MRPATSADIPALLTLVSKYWEFEGLSGFDEARVAHELRRLLADTALGSVWIATDGGSPIGYLIAVYVFSLEHLGLTAEIDEFFVLPEYRSHGLGSQLLRAAETEFAKRGCTNVFLQIGRENGSARRFYRAHGFGERTGFEMLDKMLSRES